MGEEAKIEETRTLATDDEGAATETDKDGETPAGEGEAAEGDESDEDETGGATE